MLLDTTIPSPAHQSNHCHSDRGWHRPILLGAALLLLTPAAWAQGDWKDKDKAKDKNKPCPQIHVLNGTEIASLSRGAFLGVELTNLSPELRSHFGVPEGAGTMVSKVVEGSSAEVAGLQVGDIITRLAGEDITDSNTLGRAIRRQESGNTVDIEYWRDGRVDTVATTLQENERCAVDIGQYLGEMDWSGMESIGESLEAVDWESIGEFSAGISAQAMEGALEGLRHAFEGQDWEAHFQSLEEINLDGLEERMEELQERLEQLEVQIESEVEKAMEAREDELRELEGRLEEEMEKQLEENHEQL